MKLIVSSVQVVDSEKKPVEYKVNMAGVSPDALVEAKLSLKSTDKRLLENLVPMRVGESREMKLRDVNRSLAEFQEPGVVQQW